MKNIIEFEKEKIKAIDDVEKLQSGIYLIKDLENNENKILVKNHNQLTYITRKSTGFDYFPHPKFFDYYKIIGKIKGMKISDIQLE